MPASVTTSTAAPKRISASKWFSIARLSRPAMGERGVGGGVSRGPAGQSLPRLRVTTADIAMIWPTCSRQARARAVSSGDTRHAFRLQVHQQAAWIFQCVFDAHKKGDGAFAVYDPVIIRQGHVHNWTNNNLTMYHDCPFNDIVHT